MAADDFDWVGVKIQWDGEDFELEIPHCMSGWPVQWLLSNLARSLCEGDLGIERVSVSATIPYVQGEWGMLTIGSLTLPLAGGAVGAPDKFRRIIQETADAAVAAAQEADAHAQTLLTSLKFE